METLADQLFELTEEEAKENIPFLDSMNIAKISQNIKIISQYNSVGLFISDRYTHFAHVMISKDDKICLVGFSIDNPTIEKQNVIVTQLHMSVIELEQIDNDVSLTLTALYDPCINSPPQFIIDMVISKIIKKFKNLSHKKIQFFIKY